MLLQVAKAVAQRGTCSRLQVGAVFSRDGRIISTGYNGAPKGMPHCVHEDKTPLFDNISTGVEPGCQIAEHAERNAIAYAARFGVALDGSELHVTHAPCLACARTVINAGITRVTFITPYRLTEGVDLLWQAGVEWAQLNEDGKVVDFRAEPMAF